MFAQMKHMAIVSSNCNQEGDFYRDVFGLKRSGLARAGGAVVVRLDSRRSLTRRCPRSRAADAPQGIRA